MARRTSIAEPAPASHPDRDGIEPWHSASVGPVSPGVDSTPFPKVGCWRRVRNQEGILAFHPREAFARFTGNQSGRVESGSDRVTSVPIATTSKSRTLTRLRVARSSSS